MVHGEDGGDRDWLVARSRDYLDSFKSASIHFKVPSPPILPAPWAAPTQPFVKINLDAALFDPGSFQVGAVARDLTGGCIRWSARRFHGAVSPKVAEAIAAWHALLMARDMGWTHVQLEGECLVVINTIKDTSTANLRLRGVVISACQALSSVFHSFSCSFIIRVGNCLAHGLAHVPLSDVDALDGDTIPADLAHLI